MKFATKIISCCLLALFALVLMSCEGVETSTPGDPIAQVLTTPTSTVFRPAPTSTPNATLVNNTPTVARPTATPTLQPRVETPQATVQKPTAVVPKVTAVASPTPSPSFTPTRTATPTLPSTIVVAPPPLRALSIERVFPNLEFRKLTNLVQPDEEIDRLFVTEQGGRILVFPNQQDAAAPNIFLDIGARVNAGHLEEGLLGLTFDPRFQDNGYFYVYYSASNPRRSVISRFLASQNDPNSAQADSELIIMEILQPAGNHNGGATGLWSRWLLVRWSG